MSIVKMCHVSESCHTFLCEVHITEKSFDDLMRRVVLVKPEKKKKNAKRKNKFRQALAPATCWPSFCPAFVEFIIIKKCLNLTSIRKATFGLIAV